MITIEQAAYKVADNGGDEREVFIDPMTIMLICSILSTIFAGLRLWCQWRQGQKADGNQIKETCARPPLRVRRRVQHVVREKIGDDRYRQHGEQLVSAVFQAGATASPAEIEQLADQYSYTNRFGEQETEL
jgi:hypothetical protein